MTMDQGDRVRWYIIAVGSDVDIHTPHWHGHTVLANGHRYDEVDIVPNVVVNADMHTENPGTWLFHCHVNDHIKAGMSSLYTVAPKASGSKAFTAASVREYFIAAEEVEWDYLPGGQDMCGGQSASSNVVSKYFNNGGHDSLGGRNVTKARYVEYTDATFKIKKNGIKICELPYVQPPDVEGSKTASSILRFFTLGFGYLVRILITRFRKN